MQIISFAKPRVFLGAFSLFLSAHCYAQKIEVVPANATGVYNAGETVGWKVNVSGDGAQDVKSAHYEIKKGGATPFAQGDLDLSTGSALLEAKPDDANWYFAQLTATGADGKAIKADGGAVVDAKKIGPSLPKPADFDQFWAGKIAQLRAVPMSVQLTPQESGRADIDYWLVTFDNVQGAKIYAQMARPKTIETGDKLPALLIFQYAGVYGLKKDAVVNRAAQGWLAINVMPHDLPLDKEPAFYQAADQGPLKDYARQGNDNRDTSYFLKMLLGDVRAADYIMARPDWNGRTLVAMGTSQGGYQSVALAGLMPQISALAVEVPAGSDHAAPTNGRRMGWPYWMGRSTDANHAQVLEASRYYELNNFATNIRVPSLIGMGLIDTTSTPTGVLATANAMHGPQEIVFLPLAPHQNVGGSHKPLYPRTDAWLNALRRGEAPPLAK